jgi:oxygen-independent coproporphyrinogen-3 oxidase
VTAIILYIHVPFCRFRCDYCDFFTRTNVSAGRQFQIIDRTISHALASLRRWYAPKTPISSIYVGGGTPSSVDDRARQRLLQGVRQCIEYGTLIPDSEITVEVNPEDADSRLLQELDQSGVNRLSLGVQSLRERTLRRIGRHTGLPATRKGLELIAGRWPHRWSCDVITSIPGESPQDAAEDVRNVLQFDPHHVSLYELGIEAGTRLGLIHRRGLLPTDPDEKRLAQFTAAADVLTEAGLTRYEISSFAHPDHQSRHNLAYWRMYPWVAAGPGAVALLPRDGQATHFTVSRRFREYLDEDDRAISAEPLSARELCEEYLMGGFRMNRGISDTSVQSVFGRTIEELIPETARTWRDYLLHREDRFVALTDQGRLLLNRFLIDAFGELDRSTVLPDVPRWPEARIDAANTDTSAT